MSIGGGFNKDAVDEKITLTRLRLIGDIDVDGVPFLSVVNDTVWS